MSKHQLKVTTVFFTFGLLVFSHVAVVRAQVFSPATAPPNVGVQQAGGSATVAQTGTVQQTGWGLPMPKFTMPKVTMPKMTMPSMSSVTSPLKAGFNKVSAGTKKAWEGTKEMFTFGQNKSTATVNRAAAQQQPSLWNRLISRDSEPKMPQTVGEFMAQPRIDP